MILSVSRRTDIPAFYAEWFMKRIKQGYVCVVNPFNTKQISKVNINPEVVDCIVFWSRNPKPLLNKLSELDNLNYKYYFQFTITPYHDDLEKNNPNKKEVIDTFIKLSKVIGKRKVILRYDPILITDKYTPEFHKKAFTALCEKLHEYTEKIIISYIDNYRKVSRNMKDISMQHLSSETIKSLSQSLVEIANSYQLPLETCAEEVDLGELGIAHAKCIDGNLIEQIIGYEIMNKNKLDAHRKACGCMKCIDIGQYDSCIHECLYCYANVNKEKARKNFKLHDPDSPVLIGDYDKSLITERKDVKSFRITNRDAGTQINILNQ